MYEYSALDRIRTEPSTACYGDSDVNVYGWHTGAKVGGGRGLIGWKPHAHYGDDQVDEVADHEATGQALAALRAAAVTGPVAFANAMIAEFGSTFWSIVSPYAVDIRADLLAQP